MASHPGPTAKRTTSQGDRPSGRPTSEETAQLSSDIREAALALFLEGGYDGTSLDAVARAARTTEASVYVRFTDKESLFISVIRWATGRPDWPVPQSMRLDLDFDDLEGSLHGIAHAALRRATHPSMVSLTRVVVAQAGRFPELAKRTLEAGWSRKYLVVELLERHAASGAIVADQPEILAEHFLGLVFGMPARLASFGVVRDAATERRYSDVAVELFLRGLRARDV